MDVPREDSVSRNDIARVAEHQNAFEDSGLEALVSAKTSIPLNVGVVAGSSVMCLQFY